MIADKVLARKAVNGGELFERKQGQYPNFPALYVGAGEPMLARVLVIVYLWMVAGSVRPGCGP